MSPVHPEAIAIIDFGSQYSQLIARRVRECDVYCQVFPASVQPAEIEAFDPVGFIFSGGPASVYEPNAPALPMHLIEQHKPILGICYGMQLLAHRLNGRVAPAARREYGPTDLEVRATDHPLFAGLPGTLRVWMSHGDQVQAPPAGARILASTANSPVAAFGDDEHRLYGLQFHPEVTHTPHGVQILRNFVYNICGCHGLWKPAAFIAESIEAIRAQVGDEQAVCGLSGGVDSTVAATIVQRAIGGQLTCIFVNHGLLRLGEAEHNLELFRRHLGLRVVYVDATERFLDALDGVTDPEEKRHVIGHEFIRVFEEEARKLGEAKFLVQGTLYPDVIESQGIGENAARIKSHHNVGGLPQDMQFGLVEPLRFLFKDEVRRIGLELGLPEEIVYRQPFPGPGLAVRLIGEITRDGLDVLRRADAIVRDEIAAAGLDRDVWQYFAVLTPLRTVGVMGDGRTYQHTVAVRAITSEDGMTADWARLPHDVLARISNRITNEIAGVNRVVYDITSKPPSTIEWE